MFSTIEPAVPAIGDEPPPRRRVGCVRPLLLFVVLGVAVVLVLRAAFAPWAFFLGGGFHPLPAWAGVGRMHTSSGDFQLLVEMEPTPSGRLGRPSVRGQAVLFTPRGERFILKLTGGFIDRWIGLEPDGRRMVLHLYRRPPSWGINVPDDRPRLQLHGLWRGPNLVMVDNGSLSQAFLPDGNVYLGPPSRQPAARETVFVRLEPCGWGRYLSILYLGGR